jgi:DNA polymerase I-like protein with 3'-5' exonuclease and polymerase domains
VVLHVHDEIVIETSDPEFATKEMERVMCSTPEWATGIPMNIEVQTMTRYGK